MCGRFAAINLENEGEITSIVKDLESETKKDGIFMKTKGEIFPTDTVPTLLEVSKKLSALPMIWGYPGYPDKNRPKAKPKPLINAKSETADTLRTWKESLALRRCLIPTSGFYEWEHYNKTVKNKYLFYLKGEKTLYLAGIYMEIKGKIPIRYFSILTLSANDSISDIHNRMPLIILPSEFNIWLKEDYHSLFKREKIKLAREKQD
jgi:putative SOS response-associated peptidase YedK